MVAVPMPARSGEVLGVVVLHTVAPREFDEGVLNFLVHTASLVAGAIENARLYEESRLRVDALTNLAELSERIVAVSGREELYQVVTAGVRRLLGLRRLAAVAARRRGRPARARRRSTRRASCPSRTSSRAPRCATTARRSAPWSRVRSGVRTFPAQHQELLQAVANQAALALRNAEHIERLTAENLVRALFEALDDGRARHRRGPRARRRLRPRPPPRLHPRPPAGHRRGRAAVARGRRARRDAAAHARGRRARRPGPRRAARPAPAARRAPSRRRGCAARARRRARASPSA